MRPLNFSTPIIAYIIIHYLFVGNFKGTSFYIVTGLAWTTQTLYTYYTTKKEERTNILKWRYKSSTLLYSIVIASLQITAFTISGFLTSFGNSPYRYPSIASILTTIFLFMSEIIAFETMRAYILRHTNKKHLIYFMVLTSFLFTALSYSPSRFLTSKTQEEQLKLFASELLPKFITNMFASFLVILGGAPSSIPYMTIMTSYEWFIPILPNPGWPIKTLIYTLLPLLGFVAIMYDVPPATQLRTGFLDRTSYRRQRREKQSDLQWVLLGCFAVIMIWGASGLLGPKPSVILSGSMSPYLQVGDMAITNPTDSNKIAVGDVVLYHKKNMTTPIIHRVTEVIKTEKQIIITTKGDANNAADEPFNAPTQLDKLVFVIPKIGWVTLYTRSAISKTIQYVTSNQTETVAIIITTIIVTLGIQRLRKR